MPDEVATLEAPPVETPDAPASAEIEVTDGYQRWDFPSVRETGDTAPPPEKKVEEPAPEPEPQATTEESPAPADPDDDEIERILKSPKAQQRFDQLVNNKLGNRIQQERAAAEQKARTEIAADQKLWTDATATYNRLMADESYYESMVQQNGEAEVLAFRANYQRESQRRSAPPPPPPFDTAGFAREFNHAAIGEFQNVVKATLPMYGELPAEVRQRVEAVQYDPNGNWLADAMTALGKGFETHIAGLRRKHESALREAVEAGKNDAVASREEASPIVVSGEVGDLMSWPEIELMYAEGRLPGGWVAFQQAKRKFGKTD